MVHFILLTWACRLAPQTVTKAIWPSDKIRAHMANIKWTSWWFVQQICDVLIDVFVIWGEGFLTFRAQKQWQQWQTGRFFLTKEKMFTRSGVGVAFHTMNYATKLTNQAINNRYRWCAVKNEHHQILHRASADGSSQYAEGFWLGAMLRMCRGSNRKRLLRKKSMREFLAAACWCSRRKIKTSPSPLLSMWFPHIAYLLYLILSLNLYLVAAFVLMHISVTFICKWAIIDFHHIITAHTQWVDLKGSCNENRPEEVDHGAWSFSNEKQSLNYYCMQQPRASSFEKVSKWMNLSFKL